MGTLTKKAYAEMIMENINELNKYMPEHSLEKKHIIQVLEASINHYYPALAEPSNGLSKPDFKGILKKHLYLYRVDKPVIEPKYLEVEITEAMKEVWNIAIETAAEKACTESVLHPVHKCVVNIVDKESILKLKV